MTNMFLFFAVVAFFALVAAFAFRKRKSKYYPKDVENTDYEDYYPPSSLEPSRHTSGVVNSVDNEVTAKYKTPPFRSHRVTENQLDPVVLDNSIIDDILGPDEPTNPSTTESSHHSGSSSADTHGSHSSSHGGHSHSFSHSDNSHSDGYSSGHSHSSHSDSSHSFDTGHSSHDFGGDGYGGGGFDGGHHN